jgi:hypothetical protein
VLAYGFRGRVGGRSSANNFIVGSPGGTIASPKEAYKGGVRGTIASPKEAYKGGVRGTTASLLTPDEERKSNPNKLAYWMQKTGGRSNAAYTLYKRHKQAVRRGGGSAPGRAPQKEL